MNVLLGNKDNGKVHDISTLVTTLTVDTSRTATPGKCTFTYLANDDIVPGEGYTVRVSDEDGLIFYGWIFTTSKDRWGAVSVTCYDRVRYLKAHQSYGFYNQTCESIIEQIAKDLSIDVSNLESTGYTIPSLLKSDQACIDIIQDAINQVLINTGQLYCLFDDGNGLSLRAVSQWSTDYVLGHQSLVTEYSYKRDIDSQTYNQVKYVQPNDKTGKNDVVVATDSENVERWGLLQLYKSVDGTLNTAQMEAAAKATLEYYNHVYKSLSIEAIGVNGIRAGMLVRIYLPDENLDTLAVVESASHTYEEGTHTMKLEVML